MKKLRHKALAMCLEKVTLLNEDGTILSNKFLGLSQDVRTGSILELASHLVEVGEERTSEGKNQNDNTSGVAGTSCSSILNDCKIKLNCSGIRNKSTRPRNNTSSEKDLGSYPSISEKAKFSQSSIRGADQILSTLKKPIGESICLVKEPVTEQTYSSQLGRNLSGRSVIDNPEENPEDNMVNWETGRNAQEVVQRTSIPSSSNISLRVTEYNDLTSGGVGYPEKPTINTASNIPGPQASNVGILDLLEDTQILNTKQAPDGCGGGL